MKLTKTKVILIILAIIFGYFKYKQSQDDIIAQNQHKQNIEQVYSKIPKCDKPDSQLSKPKRIAQFDYSYVRKEHKEHLVRDYFDNRPCEWDVRSFDMNKKFDLVWVFSPHQIQYNKFVEGKHLTNHIENLQRLVDKSLMVKTLKIFDKTNEQKQYFKNLSSQQFLPKTFTVNLDYKGTNEIEQSFLDDQEKGLWITKPTNLFGGKGIKVVNDIDNLKQQLFEQKKMAGKQQQGKVLVQKYIENPLLIENKKFDIRTYVFIVSTKPQYLALYHPGFIRRTLFEYDISQRNINNLNIHLTNIENQRQHPDFDKLSDQLMMSVEEFETYFLKHYTQQQLNKINNSIKEISAYTIKAAQDRLTNRKGFFQILGFDFMLDHNLDVYLIEINKSPSWQILNEKQKFKEPMLHTFIDSVLAIYEDPQKEADNIKNRIQGTDFEIIYNEYDKNYLYQSPTNSENKSQNQKPQQKHDDL